MGQYNMLMLLLIGYLCLNVGEAINGMLEFNYVHGFNLNLGRCLFPGYVIGYSIAKLYSIKIL